MIGPNTERKKKIRIRNSFSFTQGVFVTIKLTFIRYNFVQPFEMCIEKLASLEDILHLLVPPLLVRVVRGGGGDIGLLLHNLAILP